MKTNFKQIAKILLDTFCAVLMLLIVYCVFRWCFM